MTESQDDDASTSSNRVVSSKPWPEVVKLGRKIADRFRQGAHDLTVEWMGQRIAELIEQGQNGDESARRECEDLVIKLWSNRSDWPEGNPLPEISARLQTFSGNSEMASKKLSLQEPESWDELYRELSTLADREFAVIEKASLLMAKKHSAEEWLEEYGDELDKEERQVLEALDSLWEAGSIRLAHETIENVDDLTVEELNEKISKILKQINQKRQDLLETTLRNLEHTG